MDYFSRIDDDHLTDAACLLQLVDRTSFSTSNAIFAVSSDTEKATNPECIKTVKTALFALQTGPPLSISIEQRCCAIFKLATRLPNLTSKKKDGGKKKDLFAVGFSDFRHVKLTDVIRLIDLPDSYLQSGQKHYRGIHRYIEKVEKEEKENATKLQLQQQQQQQQQQQVMPPQMISDPPTPMSVVNQQSLFAASISPLSMSQQSQQSFRSSDSLSKSLSSLSISSKTTVSKLTVESETTMSKFLTISSLPETRKSSKQAQDDRTRKLALKDTFVSAYKVGSLMLKQQLDGKLPLEQFNGKAVSTRAVNIARAVNTMYGIDVLGGGEIQKCVKDDRVGQSPPRLGAKTRIPADEEAAIFSLVYTAGSLQQINCDPNTLDRPRMRQKIMEIINAKLEKDDKAPLNETKYYDRIQQQLARDVTLATTNKRDALRTAWCTYEKQKQDYITFEEAVVDLEFGRWSQTKEERREFGNIVLFKGMEHRIMNFDEMGFSYDGCKNGKRGRKAMFASSIHLPQPGQASNKSAQKNTLICGMTYAFEALVPGIILQSSAEAPRIRTQLLTHMKHVRGQFGHPSVEDPNDVKTFPVFISWSKDSSVTDAIFIEYILHLKTLCYPDAEDKPGKRVLMKADSGPGRMNKDFLAIARSHGFYFLPGLPNGTELGQEMDQAFAEFKAILEENRDLLYKTLFRLPVDEN